MSPRPDRRPNPRQDRRPRRQPGGSGRSEDRFPPERRGEVRRFRDGSPPPPERFGERGRRPARSPRPSRFSPAPTPVRGRSSPPDRPSRFGSSRGSSGAQPSSPGRSYRSDDGRRDRPWRGSRPDDRWQAPPQPSPAPEGESHASAAPSDLIWGRHSVQATLESGRPIHRIWCTPEMRFSPRFLQLLREAKASGVLVEEVTWARLGQLTGGAVHQGIALQPAAAETLDLASLIEGCRHLGEPPLLMAVDGLTDPRNLGAIVRSAEALGAHGMVLPQRRSAGLTGTVAKVAAGALEHLPVARVVNLNRSLEALRQEGYRIIGLAAEGSVTPAEADLEGPLVIVAGSESDGLSLLTRRNCDQLVRIPLRGATPSLNASVATSLMLYEVARRGWMRGVRGTAPAPRLVRPALPALPEPPAEPPIPEPPIAEPVEEEIPVEQSAAAGMVKQRERPEALEQLDAPQPPGEPEPVEPMAEPEPREQVEPAGGLAAAEAGADAGAPPAEQTSAPTAPAEDRDLTFDQDIHF